MSEPSPHPPRLRNDLRAFRRLERLTPITGAVRSLSIGVLLASGLWILFLLGASPRSYEPWFPVSIFFFLAALVLTPVTVAVHREVRLRRNILSRRFFKAGLRPEGRDRLVTNAPHPRVVVDLNDAADWAAPRPTSSDHAAAGEERYPLSG